MGSAKSPCVDRLAMVSIPGRVNVSYKVHVEVYKCTSVDYKCSESVVHIRLRSTTIQGEYNSLLIVHRVSTLPCLMSRTRNLDGHHFLHPNTVRTGKDGTLGTASPFASHEPLRDTRVFLSLLTCTYFPSTVLCSWLVQHVLFLYVLTLRPWKAQSKAGPDFQSLLHKP